MENKEQQLIETLNTIASAAEEPIFSQEDYELFKKCGMTDEQIKGLEQTEMMSGVIEALPNDEAGTQRLAAALGAISRPDPKESQANLKLIAEKDPQMLAQLMALTVVAENEAEGAE